MKQRRVERSRSNLPAGAPRKLQAVLAKVADDLPERAEPRIEIEDTQDRVLYGTVWIFNPRATRGTHIPDGRRADSLSALGLRDLGIPHPTSSHAVVIIPEGPCHLETQSGGQVAGGGIVDRAVRVDQCAGFLRELEKRGAVRSFAPQTSLILDEDNAYLVAVHQP